MKKSKYLLLALIMIGAIVSCKKNEEEGITEEETPTPTVTCKLSTIDWNGSLGAIFRNSSGQIVKVNFIDSGQTTVSRYDTVMYSADGVSMIKSFSTGSSTPFRTYSYTYSGGHLTHAEESGTNNGTAYTKTYDCTYAGGKLSSITEMGDPNNENNVFSNITWNGNNISTLNFFVGGMITLELAATVDSKSNVTKKYVPYPGDMIEYLNANNYLSVVTVNQEIIGTDTLPPGTAILSRSYTYNSNNEVTSTNDLPTAMDQNARTTVYTWNCN